MTKHDAHRRRRLYCIIASASHKAEAGFPSRASGSPRSIAVPLGARLDVGAEAVGPLR